MKKYIATIQVPKILLYVFVYLFPLVTFAQQSFGELISNIAGDIVNPLIALIIGIAVVLFLWGLVQFIVSAGSETKRTEGRQRMIWGLIALFVMFSLWGLVLILQRTVFGNDTPEPLLKGVL